MASRSRLSCADDAATVRCGASPGQADGSLAAEKLAGTRTRPAARCFRTPLSLDIALGALRGADGRFLAPTDAPEFVLVRTDRVRGSRALFAACKPRELPNEEPLEDVAREEGRDGEDAEAPARTKRRRKSTKAAGVVRGAACVFNASVRALVGQI